MNPAALKTNLKDLRAGRHPDRQLRRLRHRRPAQGRLRDQSAGGRLAQGLSRRLGADDNAQPRGRRRRSSSVRARPTAARTSSPWAWSTGSTSGRWSRRCTGSADKFAKNPAVLEANTRGAQGRLQLRRNHRDDAGPLPRAEGDDPAGPLSQDHRQRSHGHGPGRGGAALAKHAAGLRRLSDHAGQRHPAPPVRNEELRRDALSRPRTRSPPSAWPSAPPSAALGVTATSGPGICLKSEAIGLAVMTELPLVIIDVQRGGPSTGLPTKTEQADLLAGDVRPQRRMPRGHRRAVFAGRLLHDGFEAVRLAVGFMTPVFCCPTATWPTAPSRG